MASGVTLLLREQRRAASEEAKERIYGCAHCGRGTIPGRQQAFRVGDKILNTGLRSVPCTIAAEEHKPACTGRMFVHADLRVCAIVKKHTKN